MQRLTTALALIAVAVYLVGWAPAPVFMAASVAMGLLCYWEYSGLVAAHAIPRPGIFGFLAGLLIILWPEQTLAGVSILAVFAFITSLRYDNLRDVLPQVACAFLGAFTASRLGASPSISDSEAFTCCSSLWR